MSIKDGVGKLFQRAKDEASEMAQSARLTLELRQLEGRRDLLYGKIGRRVYKKRDQLGDFVFRAEIGGRHFEIPRSGREDERSPHGQR